MKQHPSPVPMRTCEIIVVKEAARRAGRSPKTIRRWVVEDGIGRKPRGAGPFQISALGLEMLMSGDLEALELLRSDRRERPEVQRYVLRLGLPPG